MKGSISARVVAPPRPGSSPTQKPTPMPSSMKANAFHCRTSSNPSQSASSIGRLLAELYVLAELVDDVLRLLQHLAHDLHRLLARGEVEIHLCLLRLGEELRVLDRLREGVAHRAHDRVRGLRRQHVRAGD